MSFEQRLAVVLGAFFLDLIFKDPDYPCHPVRLLGKSVSVSEALFYGMRGKRLAGLLSYISVAVFWGGVGFVLKDYWWGHLFFLYSFVAAGQLWKEVEIVADFLEKGRLDRAKERLAMLVTRDVSSFGENEIVRSSVETLAENTSDALFGPVLFYLLGDLPGLFVYKVTETGDSMVGYKNKRYKEFGLVFAKMDDLFNFVPSRLCALFTVLASYVLGLNVRQAVSCVLKHAGLHSSPNAGYPEAAFAGALGIRFGGVYSYFGERVFKVPIGEDRTGPSQEILKRALVLSRVTVLLFILSLPAVQLLRETLYLPF